jgi:hypothetical protein
VKPLQLNVLLVVAIALASVISYIISDATIWSNSRGTIYGRDVFIINRNQCCKTFSVSFAILAKKLECFYVLIILIQAYPLQRGLF